MATAYLDPTSNVNTLWFTNGFAGIDDGTRQPTTPDILNWCHASPSDDAEAQQWGLGALSTLDVITQAVVWLYTEQVNDSLTFQLSLEVGGAFQTNQAFSPPENTIPDGAEAVWMSKTFNTGAPWTTANFATSKIRITTPTMGSGDEIYIYSAYVELTGTAIGGGGGSVITLQGPLVLLLGSKN